MTTESRPLAEVFDRCRREYRAALITYVSGGDPTPEATVALAEAVAEGGADILEIGVPFSDPLADGPIIQAAYTRSLARGTTVHGVLDSVRQITRRVDLPIVLMTSWNPVLAFGPEQFAARAEEVGAAGVLVPDLLPEDAGEFRDRVQGHGLDTIFLAAPGMSQLRLEAASRATTGFLYHISRRGVTGPSGGVGPSLERDLARARAVCSEPIAVGFGVSSAGDASHVARLADGVIVGSALVHAAATAFDRSRADGVAESFALAAAVSAVATLTAELRKGMR